MSGRGLSPHPPQPLIVMEDKAYVYHAHKTEVVNMDTKTEIIEITEYRSTAHPEICSSSQRDTAAIELIDKNPVVYEIVTGERSKAFGVESCVYIGWAQRNNGAGAILEKVKTFMRILAGENAGEREGTIWNWRAHFTLDHYNDKGFTGGFFQCHDEYPRGCLTLDYTPDTLPEVINRFFDWTGNRTTQRITIAGKAVKDELWRGV